MYWIGGFLILTLVLPNTLNVQERRTFSDKLRLEKAREIYVAAELGDSVTIVPGEFYDRSGFATVFLGKKNRELWKIPVAVKVFNYEEAKGGLTPVEVGGGQQTISVDLEDPDGREWTLRSVNKDQKAALPKVLWPTFVRFLFRDHAAGVNPYGHLVVPILSKAINIHHQSPRLVFVPYNEKYGKFNETMAGRMAYLEENLNSSWKEAERYGSPNDIVNTEDMMEKQAEEVTPIDTALYLKTRLFDLLISDWDRHPGNWEWAYFERNNGAVFEPIPKDRDAALYNNKGGLITMVGSIFTNKFQSYRNSYGNVAGLLHQSKEMDKRILSNVSMVEFINTARKIQAEITDDVIKEAFQQYPPNVYAKVGEKHEEILKERLKKLPDVAAKFFRNLYKGRNNKIESTSKGELVNK